MNSRLRPRSLRPTTAEPKKESTQEEKEVDFYKNVNDMRDRNIRAAIYAGFTPPKELKPYQPPEDQSKWTREDFQKIAFGRLYCAMQEHRPVCLTSTYAGLVRPNPKIILNAGFSPSVVWEEEDDELEKKDERKKGKKGKAEKKKEEKQPEPVKLFDF